MSSIVHGSDPNTLLAVEYATLGVQFRTSTVQYPDAGLDSFAAGNFGKGELLGNYYGTLVDADLGRDTQKNKTYGDGIMDVTVANFDKWALDLDKRVEHGTTGSLSF